MTHQESITQELCYLSKQKHTIFLGENIVNAGRIYGTLNGIPMSKCTEMPICENLIAGAAIGLALTKYHPVIIFQRMDFMLLAADAIINHMSLIPKMSGERVKLPIIIRAIIGSHKVDFDVGPQHNHDFTELFSPYVKTIRYSPNRGIYAWAWRQNKPVMIVEDKDLYNTKENYDKNT